MDFVSDKLNSLTGDALSGINEMKRQRQQQQQDHQPQVAAEVKSSAITSNNLQGLRHRPTTTTTLQSAPFGGDNIFSHQPPPIGFYVNQQPQLDSSAKDWPQNGQQPSFDGSKQRGQLGGSEASLYEGDAWARLWFQRLMILSLIRLFLFIRKVYEDYFATKTYSNSAQWGHFLISAAALLLPTTVFTIYRVSRYLQIALPAARNSISGPTYPLAVQGAQASQRSMNRSPDNLAQAKKTKALEGAGEDDESQLRRSLMHSSSPQNDDDGLVTARQTPTNLEEFHDSKSQQQATNIGDDAEAVSPAPSTVLVKDSPPQQQKKDDPEAAIIKESVDIEKLGNIPDRENTRIVIGACEQLLHGALFVFWQLKRQVDVMGYLVDRSCLWRKPRGDEKDELDKLRTGSDGLEWFQDFYAAFLAILAQVYTLGLYWTSHDNESRQIAKESVAVGGVAAMDKLESSISHSAKVMSDTLGKSILASANSVDGKDLLIMSELVVSSAVVFSLLIAVRRRDDGPLSLGLSMLGWGSIFASRIIIIALAFVHIGWKIMLPLVVCHILGITGWIYKIAIDSHNGRPSETEEHRWAPQEPASSSPNDTNQSIELNTSGSTSNGKPEVAEQQDDDQEESNVTSQWTIMEHVVLVSQILTLFSLPSLFYWPIMFNLKLHYRPFKYLVLILSENFILIPAIWFSISSSATLGQWYLLGAVGSFSIVGFLLISLYVVCKPSLTEYFVRYDELNNAAEKSGIYFEFCSRVFKMPDLNKHAFQRLMNQSEVVEEIEVIDV